MSLIGITGGIASGKSTLSRALAKLQDAQVFDADACARDLLDADPGVREAVIRDILPTAYRADGKPDRAAIRAIVFSDSSSKARLEAILHPLVRSRRLAWAAEARAEGRDLIVDIPLLFETGALSGFDVLVTVACTPEIQIRRAMSRGLDRSQVQKIIDSQWPNPEKIARSDFVVWNDGSMAMLEAQARELATRLKSECEKIKPPVS
jgi:dephospho-CoA kinase